MAKGVRVADLPPSVQRQLGKRGIKERPPRLSEDEIRSYALEALYPLRDLTKAERRRVLEKMGQYNQV